MSRPSPRPASVLAVPSPRLEREQRRQSKAPDHPRGLREQLTGGLEALATETLPDGPEIFQRESESPPGEPSRFLPGTAGVLAGMEEIGRRPGNPESPPRTGLRPRPALGWKVTGTSIVKERREGTSPSGSRPLPEPRLLLSPGRESCHLKPRRATRE